MTIEEIKKLPEGEKIRVFIPEANREAWRGAWFIEGSLTFQKIDKETKDEKTYGIEYLQPFNNRYEMFTLKKGTVCACYQYDVENFHLI